jgi:cytochrome o ubiquinol oxidase subunit 2
MENSQNQKPRSGFSRNKMIIVFLLFFAVVAIAGIFVLSHSNSLGDMPPQQKQHASGGTIAILNPKGAIAHQERNLIVIAVLIMLIGAIPIYIMVFLFVYKFRANNKASEHAPDQDSKMVAGLIWVIPASIIFVLGVLNWKSTHALDPYKPISSGQKPITIQVVALQWKWLFIYPEQNIATVNFIQFPENTPLHFELTADAPMNSFWIPQLGGQMYAMPGMTTQLNLIAEAPGEFTGSAAEISGQGFAGMRFIAKSTPQADFNAWVRSVQQGANVLDSENNLSMDEYNRLARPSENSPKMFYGSVEKDLYNHVMMKFMAPTSPRASQSMPMQPMEGMR